MKIFVVAQSSLISVLAVGAMLYSVGIISGALPFSGTIFAWVSIAVLAIVAMLFTGVTGKLWIGLATAGIEAVFGGMSFWPQAIGFLAAGYITVFIFHRIVKHHAPAADTALAAVGSYSWLLTAIVIQELGFRMGILAVSVSSAYVWQSLVALIPVLGIWFLVLVLVSNYSKYGSLLRP